MSKELKAYVEWLTGYIENGGIPTSYFNYPLKRSTTIILKENTEIPYLCGAQCIEIIIVPVGISTTLSNKGVGHSNLYFMDGFKYLGHCVPLYSDVYEALFINHQIKLSQFIKKHEKNHRKYLKERENNTQLIDTMRQKRKSLFSKAL